MYTALAASRVLTVFISVAGPYTRPIETGRPPHLIGTSFIETGAFYYCTRVGRYRNSFWLVRSLRPAGVSREQDFVILSFIVTQVSRHVHGATNRYKELQIQVFKSFIPGQMLVAAAFLLILLPAVLLGRSPVSASSWL
jgi:hypothetical protein